MPLGYEDYFYGDGIVVIEWAEKILDILPEETLFVRLRYLDEERREIEIEGFRRRLDGIEDALKEGGFF